jgi:ABC-type branched-subunit amino acid transport system ATPase component
MLLRVTDLDVAYGPAPALWGVSLAVRAVELLSVVRPNRAAKSTLKNTLAGLLRARPRTIE